MGSSEFVVNCLEEKIHTLVGRLICFRDGDIDLQTDDDRPAINIDSAHTQAVLEDGAIALAIVYDHIAARNAGGVAAAELAHRVTDSISHRTILVEESAVTPKNLIQHQD